LAAVKDGRLPRYAVIDVGTNSVKFHIGERLADGTWGRVVDRADVSRLGEGVDEHGSIQPEPLRRTAAAVADMGHEARESGALAVVGVGTAVFRIASNGAEAVAAIRDASCVEVEVVSGEEESRLAYLAARSVVGDAGDVVVFDTGGGSSQFTYGMGREITDRFSVNVGAVAYTERFRLDEPVDAQVLGEAMAAIRSDLAALASHPRPDAVVGMGGAVTNMTAVSKQMASYDPDAIHGSVLDVAEIDRQIEMYRALSADERRTIAGLQPKRAEVILAGACIVRTILTALNAASFTVSDRGLRHGVLLERFAMEVN
jgi:exopolyphosphatase/guanosine-5'-triphosphate,3'-diphosphate pyrophosphatase